MIIGVLALQGDFLEHLVTLAKIGVRAKEVRLQEDLDSIDGLIIPGGESTTIANLLEVFMMRDALKTKITSGLPVWGTCAGMILLAKEIKQNFPTPLGVIGITVDRNAFGRQRESFSEDLTIKEIKGGPLHATFIRAPIITKVEPPVSVLATLADGKIIAAKEKHMLATAFHPELTKDSRMHEYFLSMIQS